jgi:hypothetical protein
MFTIEHRVGGDEDQSSSMSAARFGDIARSTDIDCPGLLAVAFRIVDAADGSSMDNDLGSNLVEETCNGIRISDIERMKKGCRLAIG